LAKHWRVNDTKAKRDAVMNRMWAKKKTNLGSTGKNPRNDILLGLPGELVVQKSVWRKTNLKNPRGKHTRVADIQRFGRVQKVKA